MIVTKVMLSVGVRFPIVKHVEKFVVGSMSFRTVEKHLMAYAELLDNGTVFDFMNMSVPELEKALYSYEKLVNIRRFQGVR